MILKFQMRVSSLFLGRIDFIQNIVLSKRITELYAASSQGCLPQL